MALHKSSVDKFPASWSASVIAANYQDAVSHHPEDTDAYIGMLIRVKPTSKALLATAKIVDALSGGGRTAFIRTLTKHGGR